MRKASRIVFFIAFCICIYTHAANAASHLVHIGERGGEDVGYKCHDDEICRIKIRIWPEHVVIAHIQFMDGRAYFLFRMDGEYLYASTTHYFDQQYIIIDLNASGRTKKTVYLSVDHSGIDDGLTCLGSCSLAKLDISMWPTDSR